MVRRAYTVARSYQTASTVGDVYSFSVCERGACTIDVSHDIACCTRGSHDGHVNMPGVRRVALRAWGVSLAAPGMWQIDSSVTRGVMSPVRRLECGHHANDMWSKSGSTCLCNHS